MRFAAGNFMWRPAEVGDRGRTDFSRLWQTLGITAVESCILASR